MISTINIVGAGKLISGKAVRATINAAGELMTESTPRTPYKKGELRARRRVVPQPNGARLEWTARHAGAQNAGQARGRIFRHYTTAGTGKGFAKIDPAKALAKILRLMK